MPLGPTGEGLPNVLLPHRGLHPGFPNYPLPPGGDVIFLSVGRECPPSSTSLYPALPLPSLYLLWLFTRLEDDGGRAMTITSKSLVYCQELEEIPHASTEQRGTVCPMYQLPASMTRSQWHICASCVMAIPTTCAEEGHGKHQ